MGEEEAHMIGIFSRYTSSRLLLPTLYKDLMIERQKRHTEREKERWGESRGGDPTQQPISNTWAWELNSKLSRERGKD